MKSKPMDKIYKRGVIGEGFRFGIQRFELKKPWRFPMHGHEGFSEFLYIAKGEMMILGEQSHVMAKEGDLLLLRESDVHGLKASNVLFYNVNFLKEDLEAVAKLLNDTNEVQGLFESAPSPIFKLDGRVKLEIESQLKWLFDYQRGEHGNALLMKFLMSLLVDVVKGAVLETVYRDVPPPWFLKMIDLIELKLDNALDNILGVADLAKMGNRSSEHISRSFKKYLGVTPSSYLNEKRLEKASLRLAASNDEIIAISMDLGFQSLNYFYKLFKNKYGVPPKEYRQKHNSVICFKGNDG